MLFLYTRAKKALGFQIQRLMTNVFYDAVVCAIGLKD
jgi:hypothetical protein